MIRRFQRQTLDFIVSQFARKTLQKRAEFFAEQFRSLIPPQSAVLDIGGGWGFYDRPLSAQGHFVTVLDVVRPKLQEAPVVLYEPGKRFPFADKSFDVSLLITVLHHIEDPEQVLREAKRVSRQRVLVVEDLYHHSLGRLWTQWRDQIYNMEFFGHPCQFHSESEWKVIFKRVGLGVKEYREVTTQLAGMSILNGIFALTPEGGWI